MFRKIFVAALAIRWTYALLIFAFMGDAGLQTVDSETYLQDANDFAAHIISGNVAGVQWLGPLANAMPLAQWLFTACALAFGKSAGIAYVLFQGIIDAGTCLVVAATAQNIKESYATPAGIAAAINPTQIVLSGTILTDTPFVFFVALFLLGAVRWLRSPSWRWALIIGLALGAATMIRALSAPFGPVLLLILLATSLAARQLSRRAIAQLVTAGLIFAFCISPVLWRNVTKFDSWSLTPQGGIYLALWVVPWVKAAADGTPWAQGYDEMQEQVTERFPTPAANRFEQSRRLQAVGRAELAKLGLRPLLKAWLVGAAINLGSPAIVLSPPVSNLPRTGFYGTPGASTLDKVANFLFHSSNATYAWILLIGIAGVLTLRLIQLAGAVAVLRDGGHLAVLALFGAWIAYVLAINGPIASPKYRLPIEPVLMVLTGAGLGFLRGRPARP